MYREKVPALIKFLGLTLGIALSVFAINFVVLAVDWTPPTSTPPTCPSGEPGCDLPVHVGSTTQAKSGAFGVGGVFQANSSAYLATNSGSVGIGTSNPLGKLDIKTGGIRKINKVINVPGSHYSHKYLKLFRLDSSSTGSLTISGRISAYRTNDLGVSASSEIYVSRGYQGRLYFSQIGIRRNFELVKLVEGADEYAALYIPYTAPEIKYWDVDIQVAIHSVPESDLILESVTTVSGDGSEPSPIHSTLPLTSPSQLYLDGNIGIGTTTPGAKLEVRENARFYDSAGNLILELE